MGIMCVMVGVWWVLSDLVMGKETVPFGAVSKSKPLLVINTEKHSFKGQLPNFYIHRNPVSLERKAQAGTFMKCRFLMEIRIFGNYTGAALYLLLHFNDGEWYFFSSFFLLLLLLKHTQTHSILAGIPGIHSS